MAQLVYRHWHDGLDPAVCLSVDGGAPGALNLSHWPGNRTPDRFRHDLSTGSCLLLAKAQDREEILRDITTVTNNHWDTDGVCSVFASLYPAPALAHGQLLLEAALAGDFAVYTTPEGVKLDLTLTALTKHANSPVASAKYTNDVQRRQAQYDYAMELLPALLVNPDLHLEWISAELGRIQSDLRRLREEDASVERFDALDFVVISHDAPLHPMAENTEAGCDRILSVERRDHGFCYRLRLSTLSWFDLQGLRRERPDWLPLLQELRAAAPGDGGDWTADKLTDPTPTLAFKDSAGELAPNRTPPGVVRDIVARFFTRSPFLPAGL
jgi:hypothetical protein